MLGAPINFPAASSGVFRQPNADLHTARFASFLNTARRGGEYTHSDSSISTLVRKTEASVAKSPRPSHIDHEAKSRTD